MKHKKIIFLSAFAVLGLATSLIASAADGMMAQTALAATGNYSTSASLNTTASLPQVEHPGWVNYMT